MEPDPINPLKSMIQHQLFQLGIGYTTPVGAYQKCKTNGDFPLMFVILVIA